MVGIGAFVVGAGLGAGMAFNWFTAISNKFSRSATNYSVSAITAALGRLERGEVDAARFSLHGDLINHIQNLVHSNSTMDYIAAQKVDWRQEQVVENRLLDQVSEYCDRVRLLEQKDFRSDLFHV